MGSFLSQKIVTLLGAATAVGLVAVLSITTYLATQPQTQSYQTQAAQSPIYKINVSCNEIYVSLENKDNYNTFTAEIHVTRPDDTTHLVDPSTFTISVPPGVGQKREVRKPISLTGAQEWGHKWVRWVEPASWGETLKAAWGYLNCVPPTPTLTPVPTLTPTPTTTPQPQCTTGSDCNDDNPCTSDICDNGTCRNSNLPNGGSCNVSGSTGTCNNGLCCTGCWDGASCRLGNTNTVCGTNGTSCENCANTGQSCSNGQCVSSCQPPADFATAPQNSCGFEGSTLKYTCNWEPISNATSTTTYTYEIVHYVNPLNKSVIANGTISERSISKTDGIEAGKSYYCRVKANQCGQSNTIKESLLATCPTATTTPTPTTTLHCERPPINGTCYRRICTEVDTNYENIGDYGCSQTYGSDFHCCAFPQVTPSLTPLPTTAPTPACAQPTPLAVSIHFTDSAVCGNAEAQAATTTTVDVNGDGQVDGADVTVVLSAWGSSAGDDNYNPQADLDNDGKVGALDGSMILSAYGG